MLLEHLVVRVVRDHRLLIPAVVQVLVVDLTALDVLLLLVVRVLLPSRVHQERLCDQVLHYYFVSLDLLLSLGFYRF